MSLSEKLLTEAPFEGGLALACRWLVENGDARRGLDMVRRIRALVEDGGWERSILATWLLEARALEVLAEDSSLALRRALTLGAETGFVQVLADEREWLAPILRDDRRGWFDGLDEDYRRRLSACLELSSLAETGVRSTSTGAADSSELSERELEVLASVAQGRTNAEVGQSLYISPSTVKKHLENIYGKLSVGGRLEAVNKAHALGLLRTPEDGPRTV
ncbi:MAG: LuxR C-terminal-related transcriptional regulator [Thermoanaerobaculia bacterium]|nr:LuxR C-terminal-related transcriptional regulator [Thermoanaerobaculia bacterium]